MDIIRDTECRYCGSKEHASSNCPHDSGFWGQTECRYCGSKEHASNDCPHDHGFLGQTECRYCGSKEHASDDCPHDHGFLGQTKCRFCGGINHGSDDCPHDGGFLGQTDCRYCGSNEHASDDCPHEGLFGSPRSRKAILEVDGSAPDERDESIPAESEPEESEDLDEAEDEQQEESSDCASSYVPSPEEAGRKTSTTSSHINSDPNHRRGAKSTFYSTNIAGVPSRQIPKFNRTKTTRFSPRNHLTQFWLYFLIMCSSGVVAVSVYRFSSRLTPSKSFTYRKIRIENAGVNEGWQMGQWFAKGRVLTYDNIEGTEIGVLRPGDQVKAVSSVVLALPVDARIIRNDFPAFRHCLEVGKIIKVLHPIGEGGFAMLLDNRIEHVPGEIKFELDVGRKLDWQWWVEVVTSAEDVLWVKNPMAQFTGMDRHE